MNDTTSNKDHVKTSKSFASLFSSKGFRLVLALVIFGTAVAVMIPRVAYYRSINAVVSGRLTYFLAPVEGRVVGQVPDVGDWVDAQDMLVHLRNFRLNHGVLFELITEHDSLESRVSALDKQMALARGYFDDFQARTAEWQHAAIEALDGEYTQVDYEKKAATARETALQAQKIEAEARMKRISKQIEKEQARLDQEGEAIIKASFEGVVWEVNASSDREMLLGEELLSLLDCNSTFLDVLVPERRYEDIRIGDEIQYRLSGETEFRTAHVQGRRGAVATVRNKTLAAQVTSDSTDAFRIEADLGDLTLERRDFCNVGRRAEVRFNTDISLANGSIRDNLLKLRDAIAGLIPASLIAE